MTPIDCLQLLLSSGHEVCKTLRDLLGVPRRRTIVFWDLCYLVLFRNLSEVHIFCMRPSGFSGHTFPRNTFAAWMAETPAYSR